MNSAHKLSKPKIDSLDLARAPRASSHNLSLATEQQHRAAAEERNPDPYNTSGSFDRTKNWARVGKR
jgi:hypothetical protein